METLALKMAFITNLGNTLTITVANVLETIDETGVTALMNAMIAAKACNAGMNLYATDIKSAELVRTTIEDIIAEEVA